MRNNIINVIKPLFTLHSSFDSVHYVSEILSTFTNSVRSLMSSLGDK